MFHIEQALSSTMIHLIPLKFVLAKFSGSFTRACRKIIPSRFTSSLSSFEFYRPLKFEKSIHNYPCFSIDANIKLCFTEKHFHDETFV